MENTWVLLSIAVAFSLLSDDMDNTWFFGILCCLYVFKKSFYIMTVNRSYICESQFFKENTVYKGVFYDIAHF